MYQLRNQLRNQLSHIGYCNLTVEAIHHELYGDMDQTEHYLIEDYQDHHINTLFSIYVVYRISLELYKTGSCTITIRNDTGKEATLMHVFVLFLIDNQYYRMESYGNTFYMKKGSQIKKICKSLYTTRIVEWPTWQLDLIKLIEMNKYERLVYWNRLFNANETIDNDHPLDITLTTIE